MIKVVIAFALGSPRGSHYSTIWNQVIRLGTGGLTGQGSSFFMGLGRGRTGSAGGAGAVAFSLDTLGAMGGSGLSREALIVLATGERSMTCVSTLGPPKTSASGPLRGLAHCKVLLRFSISCLRVIFLLRPLV